MKKGALRGETKINKWEKRKIERKKDIPELHVVLTMTYTKDILSIGEKNNYSYIELSRIERGDKVNKGRKGKDKERKIFLSCMPSLI